MCLIWKLWHPFYLGTGCLILAEPFGVKVKKLPLEIVIVYVVFQVLHDISL